MTYVGLLTYRRSPLASCLAGELPVRIEEYLYQPAVFLYIPGQQPKALFQLSAIYFPSIRTLTWSIGIMLRPGRASSLAHSIVRSNIFRGARNSSHITPQASKPLVSLNGRSGKPTSLALTAYRPLSTSLQRWAIAPPKHPETPYDHIDKKHEKDVGKTELEPHPEEVSMESSVHQVFQEKGVPETEKDEDMLAGVYSDIVRRLSFYSGVTSTV